MAKKSTTNPLTHQFTGEELFCIFSGKEAFLKELVTQKLQAAIEKAVGDELDLYRFDGSSAELADVFDELRGVGLMMQRKLVIVDSAEDFVSKHRQALERYADQPEATATLLLRADTWRPGKLDKGVKAMGAAGSILKCEPIDTRSATAWVKQRVKQKYERDIEVKAANLLVDRRGSELGPLDSELSKLAISGDITKPISEADVLELVGQSSDEQWWAIEEALLSGDMEATMRIYTELIDLAGHHEMLVGRGISNMLRKLAMAAELMSQGVGKDQIAKQLKIWPAFKAPMYLNAARKLGPRGTAQLLDRLVALDAGSKSGQGDFRTNMERFCISFCYCIR